MNHVIRLLWMFLLCGASLLSAAQAAVTITRKSAPILYVGTAAPQLAAYAAYDVTSTVAVADAWVKWTATATGGSTNVIGTATNENGLTHIGPLAANTPKTVFFYLQAASAATATTLQSHTVGLYEGSPTAGGTLQAAPTFTLSVESTISAAANKVTVITSVPNPPPLGGTLVVTVEGDTGQIGSAKIMALTPASQTSWPSNVLELVSTTVTLTGGNTGTFSNALAITPATTSDTHYVARYTFRAINTTSSSSAVSPVGYISSGGQVKFTGSAPATTLNAVSSTTTLTKSVSPTSLIGGGTATFTVTATNTSSGAVTLDGFYDTLPAGTSYVAGSSTYAGSAIPNPAISGQNLNWGGLYSVPAGGSASLSYQVSFPSTTGAYTNSVYALMGDARIDRTLDTADTAPATATVNVGTPDLTLTKTHTGNFMQGQIGATYSLTARNVGTASTAGTVTVTDTLPTGLTATAVSGTGWTCILSTLSCTRSDALANGSSYPAITLTVTVASNAPASVTNTAAVSGGGQTNTTNDTASDPTTINPATPDMTITKSHTGNFAQTQTGATYTLTATNSGTAATSGAVTVTDTLPAGLTATAIGGIGWTCTLGTLSCTRSDGLAAGSSYPVITLTVDVAANAPSSVTNTAAISGGGQTNTANDMASDPTTITVTPPDLTLIKTHTGSFTVGQPGSFTFTVNNIATGTAISTITVTDSLPAGLTLPNGAVTLTGANAANWSCSSSSNIVTCTSTLNILGGGSSTFTLTGIVVGGAAVPSVTNAASVSTPGEVVTGNNGASDTVSVLAPDLTVTKTHVGNFTAGGTGAYTITATNSGTAPTSGTVSLTDTLPGGMTATAISGLGWTCDLGTLTCTRSDNLGTGASYPMIVLAVNIAANSVGTLTNTVTVSGGGEVNTANNTASDPTIVEGTPDLTLTKTHAGNFSQGQTGATYTLTASNIGTAPTSITVTVTDTLPTGLTATALSGLGWTCDLGTLSCSRSDALVNGASYPAITLTVDVAANAPASVTNQATVSGGGQTNTTNDAASDPTTIGPAAPDLTLTKTHTGNFTQGQTGAAYTITATNSGTAATSGTVTVTDTLPAGLSATAIGGMGWTCTLGTLSCARSDVLAAGSSYPAITLTVDVDVAAASVTNTATVSGGSQANTANDTASDPTTVAPGGAPDLTLIKSHTGSFFQGQTGATYTLSASNGGSAPTSGAVTVTDTLPAGLTAKAIGGTGWTCDLGTLSCTRSDALAAGSTYPPITLTVNVAANAPVSVTNTAAISGGGQTNTANDSASDPTTVEPRYNISGTVYSDLSANGQLDTGESGLSGVTLTLRDSGGAALATTTSGAGGTYSFPLLPAGTYSVSETQPAGVVSTSPDSVSVTITSASVQNVNFGEFAGTRVNGQVFRDDGWGAAAGQANDALQNGTEAGISGLTVTASNGGGVVATTLTDGAGRYTLYLPASAGSVTVLASPTPTYTATGVNDGSAALHRASTISDPLASRSTVDAASAAGQTRTLNFGLVPQLSLTPDSAQAVTSPGSVIYRQRLTPGTPGTLTLNVSPSAGSVFSYQLWHDVNSNGQIDPGADTPLGTGGSLTLTSSSPRNPDGTLADLQLLLSVSAPAGIASGLSDPARLGVSQSLANLGALIRTDSVTDTTTTGPGGLKLSKFVRNVTAASGFSATSAEGQTGDTLEYCINYQNLGSRLLQAATLTDPVPFFTAALSQYGAASGVRHVPGTLALTGQTATPGTAGDNLSSAADADAGTLVPRLLTVNLGDLAGGAQGTVCYRVAVQ